MSTKLQIVRRAPVEQVDFDRLIQMRPDELQRLHRTLFGGGVSSGNSEQARRRIAWRVQAEREGGLPESAKKHALALATEAGTRIRAGIDTAARPDRFRYATVTGLVSDHDSRLPMAGSIIVKQYRGRQILVRVLDTGFEYNGWRFTSLSAIAKEITGTKWNGLAFFGLAKARVNGR